MSFEEDKDTSVFYNKEGKVLERMEKEILNLNEESKFDNSNIRVEDSYIEWPKPYNENPYILLKVLTDGLAEKKVLDQIDPTVREVANDVYDEFSVERVMIEGF